MKQSNVSKSVANVLKLAPDVEGGSGASNKNSLT